MEIVGYMMAFFIGFAMGLMGGGGSILAVPVFAYLFGFDEKISTAYSLFIVGICAIVGAISQNRNGFVNFKYVFAFGLPSTISVWLTRRYIIQILPEEIFQIGDFIVTRRMVMFGVFALLMVFAARSMLKKKEIKTKEPKPITTLVLLGLMIGFLTGFVGAGGGFLIVPALVILTGLDIKKAIGTSLTIIAFNSMIGFFFGDAMQMRIDWTFLVLFAVLALIGIFVGGRVGQHVDGKKLKRGFAFFVIIMAAFIFTMEFVVN